ERLDRVYPTRVVVQPVQEVDVAKACFVRKEGDARVLGTVSESRVGDELGFGFGCRERGRLVFELDGRHPAVEVVVDAFGVNLALGYHVPLLKRSQPNRTSL